MERRRLSDFLVSPRRVRAEVDEEIRHHLELRAMELEKLGLSSSQARDEALRRFGDVGATRRACVASDLRRARLLRRKERLEDTVQDVVHGLRQLRRRPAFAGVAIATLAVGIGATTAVFSAADHVIFRPLPYAESDRVVTLWETDKKSGERMREVSPGNFYEWSQRAASFESMGLAEPFSFDLTGDGPPVSVPSWLVTEGFFEALGARPLLGRTFTPAEHLPNAEFAVIMSHRMWTQRFGADPTIIGRTIQVESRAARVVGVAPRWLDYPDARDLYGPKHYREGETEERDSNYMLAVARLRPGVSVSEAQADLDRIAAALAVAYQETNADAGVNVVPLRESILGDVRPAILVLLGAVAFLLLIAAANVASLLLARGLERQRELGVRAALGAGRARLVRQLATESAILAALGGVAGLAFAWLGVKALAALSPPELPRIDSITIDGQALAFAAAISLGTAILFGLAPAVRFSRPDVVATLRSGSRSATASRERVRLRGALVVGEIALALMLLIGAGLLVRSFADLLGNDLGFATENRASIQVFVYDDVENVTQRLQRVAEYEERMESVPGVLGVAITSALPFHPSRIDAYDRLSISGRPQRPREREQVLTSVASPDYFRVMDIPLISGRGFTPEDRLDAPAVAIVNQRLAQRFFPGEDPIGKRVTFGVMSRPSEREIVGVVGDVRPTAFDSEPQPEIFVPYAQRGYGGVTFVIRADGDPARLLPVLQQKIWEVFPRQSIYHAGTLDNLVSATLVERRFHLVVLSTFSLVALVLATIGIYGLIAFSTRQRTGEIGVRIAMGARPTDVVGLVVRQALRLALPGIALGVVGALLLTRFMERMLYGVTPTDLGTFAQIACLMLIICAAAAFQPARRAAAANPVATLREE